MNRLTFGVLALAITLVAEAIPWPEHPRPDFMRKDWQNLNGQWKFAGDNEDRGLKENWQNAGGAKFPLAINVPFGWGTKLSGVDKVGNRGWYRREIKVPESWKGKRIFLVIGAADHLTDCWFAGKHLGRHEGGYTPFEFELTDGVKWGSSQPLTIRVDDSWYKWVLSGKQYNYGEVRGIWQTVYLEARGRDYIESIRFHPNVGNGEVEARVTLDRQAERDLQAELRFKDGNRRAAVRIAKGEREGKVKIRLENPHLWELDDPYLYEVDVTLGEDCVSTYFGMRSISVVNMPNTDIPYVALNGKPIYLRLALDQSFTPDGFYTFPDDAYAKREIEIAKELGLNGLRVHVKVEMPRKLYWADKLGMLIQADMPNCWGDPSAEFFAAHRYALENTIRRDFNHPSVYQWTLFNETWGLMTHYPKDANGKAEQKYLPETQTKVREVFEFAKRADPTRMVEDMSPTFNDHVVTDVNSWHTYAPGYWWEHVIKHACQNTHVGSGWNYIGGGKQGREPMMNSECGNVWGYKGYLGDMDWSWDYHLMMDAFRRHLKCSGFLYTEHHDVRNEWNGYVRADRTWKETGFEELFPGMTMRDLHADAYVSLDREMCREGKPGSERKVEVDISLTTDRYAGHKLELKHFLRYHDGRGKPCDTFGAPQHDASFTATSWQTGRVAEVSVKLPDVRSAGIIGFMLEDGGKVIARNFTCFHAKGERDDIGEKAELAAAEWNVKHWNVMEGKKECGAGKGYFEYRVKVPKDAWHAVFRAEVATKRLYAKDLGGANTNSLTDLEIIMGAGTTDRAKNPNSYPMTSTDKWPGVVKISANGRLLREVPLQDDPADHRGILSWLAQKRDGYLHDAGSYGYLCEVEIPTEVLLQAQDGMLTIRLESDKNGLAVYGEDVGRFPFGPTVEFGVGAGKCAFDRLVYTDQAKARATFDFVCDKPMKGFAVEASLKDAKGAVLQRRTLARPTFHAEADFAISDLPSGTYTGEFGLKDAKGSVVMTSQAKFRKIPPIAGGPKNRYSTNGEVFLKNGKFHFPIITWHNLRKDDCTNRADLVRQVNEDFRDIAGQGFTAVLGNSWYFGEEDTDVMAVKGAIELFQMKRLRACRAAGLTFHDFCQMAEANGLEMIAGSPYMRKEDSEETISLFVDQIRRIREEPNMMAYLVSDEQDGRPDHNRFLNRLYHDMDSKRVTWVNMISHVRANADAADIISTDPYPIPGGKVTKVADFADDLRKNAAGRKPFWMWIQNFGGEAHWERPPTPEEIRCMTFLAVNHGVKGLAYFTWMAADTVTGKNQHPKAAEEMKNITALLRKWAEPLCLGKVVLRKTADNLDVLAVSYRGRKVISAVNASGEAIEKRRLRIPGFADAMVSLDGFGTKIWEVRK